MSVLSVKIRTARREAYLSQYDLGMAIGVSDKSVSAYEQGRSVPPITNLKKIAEATKQPLAYFLGEESMEDMVALKLTVIERLLGEVKAIYEENKKH